MRRPRPLAITTAIVTLLILAPAGKSFGDDEPAEAFRAKVAPLVEAYCVRCHGVEKPKGEIDLAALVARSELAQDRDVWERVLENVETGVMPPEDPFPTDAEIEGLVATLQSGLSTAGCDLNDPGHVTLRRLNRSEYRNTIRDLVGIDFEATDDFPSDDVGYGFDNIGDVLTLPPLLLEKYLAAAGQISFRAIVTNGRLDDPRYKREVEDRAWGGDKLDDGLRRLTSDGEIKIRLDFPADGDYAIRLRAFGDQAGDEPVKLEVRVEGQEPRLVEIPATRDDPGVYDLRMTLPQSDRRLVALAFVNDYYQPDAPEEEDRGDRNLYVDWIEVVGPIGSAYEALPEIHRRIVFTTPDDPADAGQRREAAGAILRRFSTRAYRRSVTDEEVGRLVELSEMVVADGGRFEEGIQLAVQAVLSSPHFIYKVEVDHGDAPDGEPLPLSDYEVATRLSYFLWSSMPDDELFGLAAEGRLRDPVILEAQARRMLDDPKAQAFVENFAGQWLQLRNLKAFNPDLERFPGFDDPLRADLRRESELFFASIFREDRSLLDFLTADYTYLNERLAEHYGIEGVQGEEFRRVSVAGTPRGGILTQGSILAVTSNPTRTSPVKRGKWILEQVLGTPPPPPPPDVPELMDTGPLSGTLRQKMEQHRSDPACASCHAKMDPLGFGFENFDAVGRWRDREGDYPVDPSGVLPDGTAFRGPQELKAVLAEARRDDFVRCFTEKMLTYALGRGLEYTDDCHVDTIVQSLAAGDFRATRLVAEIVKSDPFLKRKREGGEEP